MTERRAPLKIIRRLEEALRYARMERATFGMPYDTLQITSGLGRSDEHVKIDEFVKERTRLWRQTWLIPEIEAALKWAKGERCDD